MKVTEGKGEPIDFHSREGHSKIKVVVKYAPCSAFPGVVSFLVTDCKHELQENDDEELPEDELPEWKREPPKVDLSQVDASNPENLLKASKKGRTLMMFATVSGEL